MTEAEVNRALDDAYAHIDKAYVAVNGAAIETRSSSLAALAEAIRKARDELGRIELQDVTFTAA